MSEAIIRRMRFSAVAIAALAVLGVLGADPIAAVLDRKLLPGGNRIVYDNMLKAVYEADLAADEAWTACKTPAELAAYQRKVRAARRRCRSTPSASCRACIPGGSPAP